ncbi:MAG: CTP synthase, partial [Coriobacteriales bacterium]|jgi:CTP synthase|nr:CTP synthase [Coriobacteriales bacterium]
VLFVHVTLVPYIVAAHEVKTKPTQHSVKELRSIGVQPDFIVCRSDHDLPDKVREKIALFCDVKVENVINCIDAESIYQVPLNLYEQDFDTKVLETLLLQPAPANLDDWRNYIDKMSQLKGEVDIAVVGKYVSLPDAYLSVIEALGHAGVFHGYRVSVHLVDGETLKEDGVDRVLGPMDGILVPGGFGIRAFEGKIAAVRYAREKGIPFLGICLGLHAAVCEFARNIAGMENANSAEFENEVPYELKYPVIDLMPEQEDIDDLGGTMRLGAYPCKVREGSKALEAYGETIIYERHRHRYEVNNMFRERLADAGLVISGISPDARLVEMIELADHPWFVASQGHPEFKSRPTRPHPLFRELVRASITRRDERKKSEETHAAGVRG